MRRHSSLPVLLSSILACLALLASLVSTAHADDGDGFDLTQGLAAPELPGQDGLTYPNLGSALSSVADGSFGSQYGADFATGGGDAPTDGVAASPFVPGDTSNQTSTMVALSIIVDGDVQRVVNVINGNGGDVRNVLDNYIEAYVPTTALATLARTPGVSWARELEQPVRSKGSVVSGGVRSHLASAWHNAGIKGQGVKVGVLDYSSTRTARDGFVGTPGLMGTDLPGIIAARCYTNIGTHTNDVADCSNPSYGSGLFGGSSDGSDHGTLVAETVMDMAPAASLYISNPASYADLRSAVEWMHGEGVKVIVYSVNWSYHGPPDGTSPFPYGPLNTVKWAADNGIVFVNSAGNQHLDSWYGAYNDGNKNNIQEWDGSAEDLRLSILPGRETRVIMRWDDKWGGAENDLSLIAVRNPGQLDESVIYTSDNEQDGGANHYPKELMVLENSGLASVTVALRVKSTDGSKPSWIQLVVWGGGVLHSPSNGYSIGSPADSPHPGVLGVGAGSPTGLYGYSSRGPTPDGRIKPDIVGAACQPAALRNAFCGTSAAAPHVAGLAALVVQMNPEFTASQVAGYLETHAAPRRGPVPNNDVPNNEWGHGFAQLPSPTCVDDLNGSGTTSGNWDASCRSATDLQKHSRYYTFSLTQQTTVTLDLASSIDSYLHLRGGYNAKKGTALHQDDNSGSGTNARISQSLAAGTYTIEATTAANSQSGAFSLNVSGLTAVPVVSLSGGGDITEGSSTSFTLSATPPPSSPLSVKVQVVATGDFDTSPTGLQTVTIPTTGSTTLTVSTVGDNQAEPGGIISAQLLSSSDYHLSADTWKRVVAIKDDDNQTISITADGDITETQEAAFRLKSNAGGAVKDVRVAVNWTGDLLVADWVIPPVMTVELDNSGEAEIKFDTRWDAENEPHGLVTLRLQSASHYEIDQNAAFANVIIYDNDVEPCVEHLRSDISTGVGGGPDCPSPRVGGGGSWYYTFQLSQRLTISLDHWSSHWDPYLYLRQGRNIKDGAALYEDDNGGIHGATSSGITATLDPGWYTVEATSFGARPGGGARFQITGLLPMSTKGVEVSVMGGLSVDEGGGVKFTVAAHPLPSTPVTANVEIATDGDFGVTTGTHTVTIPTNTGKAELFLSTSDDAVREDSGSVTATVTGGTGYDVSPTMPSSSVTVYDNDFECTEALPESGKATDQWTPKCRAVGRFVNSNGRFYTFELKQSTTVTVDLMSQEVDPFLLLYNTSDVSDGAHLYQHDDIDTNSGDLNSRIENVVLPAGQYTIEAATSAPSKTGKFELNVTGLPAPSSDPEISIASDGDITEGTDASFTLTASPKPAASLDVTVDVTQSGDYVTTGSQTVTITTSGTATLTVPTTDDSDDEPDGSVTATVDSGTGYTVSSNNGAATAAVADDDDAASLCTTQLTDDGATQGDWTDSCESSVANRGFARFYTFQLTQQSDVTIHLTSPTDTYLYLRKGNDALSGSSLYQNDDIGGGNLNSRISRTLDAGWYTIEATTYSPGRVDSFQLEITGLPAQTSEPEIGIAAGAGITEGGDATFTLTATPSPSADLDVTIEVSQSGDYVTTGSQTVTIPTSGSHTLTVATTNDSNDEADGSVTATISTGTGYTVSSSASSATVAVSDDDVPVPEISIAAGAEVSEGGDATFTVTASPVPATDLDVTIAVSQSGDYATTGSQTVTIPTSGSYTLTVATTDDSADEPDGSVTATINTGTGYTVSSSSGSATVAVSDDDVPEISIAAGSGVTEGGDATFTLTASPSPHVSLSVGVSVAQSGDYGATTGSQTVTIPTSGTYTLTVPTTNDNTDEPDGSVTATINTGTGYTVSTSSATATVAVSDDDAGGQTPPQDVIDTCVSDSLLELVRGYYDANKDRAPKYGRNWKRVLIAFADVQDSQLTPFTATEALAAEQIWFGWKPVRQALECIEKATTPPPPADPEISITPGAGITEGGDATFTVTATPNPSADLDVTIEVSQNGDYVTTGSRTVTITTSGSATLTVSTTNDTTDEADGSVTATLSTGTGYTVSSSAGTATVAVWDDDVPEISIAAGSGVTEGTDASFTLTASPTPAADLDVTIDVTQSGDYVTTGSRTVTIPSSGSKIFTITTTDDSDDEPDGSVTATIDSGTGYTVSSGNGAATVSISDDDVCTATLPADAVTVAEVTGWRDGLTNAAGIERFNRVLAALGVDTGLSPMPADVAQQVADWLGNTRWDRIARTLAAMEQHQCDAPPPPDPEISIAAGSGVTEGSDATFTVTASPSPTSALTVNLTVSQSGSFGAATGADTVTIPTSGSATYTVSTTNDSTDEPDGSVTATINTGTGYTVSTSNGAATVAVSDDDDPPPAVPEISITAGNGVTEGNDATFTVTATPTPTANLDITIAVSQSGTYTTTGTRTVTIPTSGTYTLTVTTTNDSTDEPDGSITATINTGTGYTVSTSSGAATVAVSDDDDPPPATPEISITAGNGVTEGNDATFTVTASPNPTSALTVNLTVSQSGSFGATTGADTVTIPTSGTYTLTVTTTNDNTDEPDGSITATINTGTGYTVSTSNGAATVAVSDDDDPPAVTPVISITAGSAVTEGSDATFTVTASPSPTSALTVNLTVSQSGSFGAATGADTVTIPTSGSATYTVSTTNDSTDEPDGSITATLASGTGYSVSSNSNSATVAVSDDDDPRPSTGPITVSVSDASATEGDQGLVFIVTLSRASTQTIVFRYGAWDQSARLGQDFSIPYQAFTLDPGETELQMLVPIIDDTDVEDDETLLLFVYATSGITIPGYFIYADGTIIDND